MKKPFVVAHIAPPQPPVTGDFIYRVLQPDRALGRVDGFSVISLMNISPYRKRILLEADLLVTQMLGDPDLLPIFFKRKKAGKPTVFEVSDNFFSFQPSNPSRGFYENPEMQILLLQLITRADAVQFTTPELERRFSTFNGATAVFPNQLETVPPLQPRPTSPVVVGWGGSQGHLDDIRAIAPALSEWIIKTPGVLLAIMSTKQIFDLFKKIPDDKKRFVEAGPLEDYINFLDTLHVGIAPLKKDQFNLCRSDVKFIEYASHGVVSLCSRLPTYAGSIQEGVNGFTYESTEELVETLDKLCRNPELLSSVSKNAHDYISRERTEQLHAEKRADFYNKLLVKPSSESGKLWKWITSQKEACKTPKSRHCFMEFSHAEKLVYAGMDAQFRGGRTTDAINYFRAASEETTDYYLPFLYLTSSLRRLSPTQPTGFCIKALEIEPDSPAAKIALAEITNLILGKELDAIQLCRESVKRFPCHVSSWLRLADMQKKANLSDDYTETIKQALEAEPLNFIAGSSLLVCLIEAGKFTEAEALINELSDRYAAIPTAQTILIQDVSKSDKPELAAHLLINILKKNTDEQSYLWELIKICNRLHELKRTEIAIFYLNEASRIFPDNPELTYRVGRLHQKFGNHEIAKESWNKLLSNPNAEKYHKLAKSALEEPQ